MGIGMGKTLAENQREQQEFMVEMQRIQLERQIQTQNLMRERAAALQIAKSRELLYWFASFYAISAVGLLVQYRKTRRSSFLAPLVPLSFILGYQADLAYGTKLMRIRAEAETIMDFERNLLDLPYGVPTASAVDQARMKQTDERRLQKVHDIYF